jgi:hypothetical protein
MFFVSFQNRLNAKLRRLTNVLKTQDDNRRMTEHNLSAIKEKLKQIQNKK